MHLRIKSKPGKKECSVVQSKVSTDRMSDAKGCNKQNKHPKESIIQRGADSARVQKYSRHPTEFRSTADIQILNQTESRKATDI